jgi:hypothetical protein
LPKKLLIESKLCVRFRAALTDAAFSRSTERLASRLNFDKTFKGVTSPLTVAGGSAEPDLLEISMDPGLVKGDATADVATEPFRDCPSDDRFWPTDLVLLFFSLSLSFPASFGNDFATREATPPTSCFLISLNRSLPLPVCFICSRSCHISALEEACDMMLDLHLLQVKSCQIPALWRVLISDRWAI